MRNQLIKLLSTFFYVGYLPVVSGSFASLVGVLIFYFTRNNFPFYIGITLCVSLAGLLLSGEAEKIWNKKDARCIVIDEVSGMLLSFLFVPYDLRLVVIGLLFFRILDITKPYPANRIQDLGGSIGIMGDDFVAAMYTNIILQVLSKVIINL